MNQEIRANIIAVLSRVREPRSLADISWHIPHYSRLEVGYVLDAMAIRDEIEVWTHDGMPIMYSLRQHLYRIPDTRANWNPERALVRATLLVIGVGLVGLAAILWSVMP
jgi:hypothetical protein